MLNNIVKTPETNQLPSEVAADQITNTTPFNSEAPSALTPERIKQINRLCLEAELKSGFSQTPIANFDHMSLMLATSGMKEVLEAINDFDSFIHFYRVIDGAFESHLEKNPTDAVNVMRTYKRLTSMFRILNKHNELIYDNLTELNQLTIDVDTLEQEGFNSKGGASC
jgi:hypothetical protein